MAYRSLACLASIWLAALPLPAQGAAGTVHFVSADAFAPGGAAQSAQFALAAAFGPAPAAERAAGGVHALEGGFAAALGAPVAGRPWLTGVVPPRATMRGGAALTLWGTELDLGTGGVSLTIGGVSAVVSARTRATITTTLPAQPAPGPQPVVLTTPAGRTTLPAGIGVLPMVEARPFLPDRDGELVYRGAPGDLVVWAFALGTLPSPLRIGSLGHGFQLDPGRLLAATGGLPVIDPGGVLRVRVPPLGVALRFWVQAVALSADPGYAPGSFTNVLTVF